MDEVDFALAADGINNEGIPQYYRGEHHSEHLGLYHPPLFIHTLAFSFQSFGVSEVSAHIVPFLFSLATLVVVYFLALELFKNDEKRYTIALLGSSIYAINPLVIQNGFLSL